LQKKTTCRLAIILISLFCLYLLFIILFNLIPQLIKRFTQIP